MEMVTNGRLCQLSDQNVGVAEYGLVEHAAFREQSANNADVHNVSVRRGLHKGLVGHRVLSEEQRCANHPLDAGETDLHGGAVMSLGEEGDHPVVREVASLERIPSEGREMAGRE